MTLTADVMIVSWISAGVSSFIATYLCRDKVDKIVYIDIDDQHNDSIRFIKDCEKALNKEIEIIKSEKYNCVEDVILKKKFINSPYGSPCSLELKRRVREKWEEEQNENTFTYIWGYDSNEKKRAERLKSTSIEYTHIFPLIEKNLTKQDCHALLKKLGIKRPVMYELGYPNNNCIGCVKGGMGYWNQIRKDFPDVFKKMAKIEREIGHSCIKGVFLDELDANRGREQKIILEDCGMFCKNIFI